MSKPFTPQQLLCHQIWLKAKKEGKFEVKCPSLAEARSLRFSLYNSVKAVREGKVILPELLQAVEECSISMDSETFIVTVRDKMQSDLMQDVLKNLGMTAEEVKATAPGAESLDPEAAASAARVMERLGMAGGDTLPGTPRSTPYYDRES